jgi:hypothetical protein
MKFLFLTTSWIILSCLLLSTAASRWKCSVVLRHRHYELAFWRLRISRQSSISKWFRFRHFTPYSLTEQCQSDWNKLWGKSRCGNHHHDDSDRFVWRATTDGNIQLAAYAYDQGKKPFQNEGTLLKTFTTTIAPQQKVGSKIEWFLDRTEYSLFDENGTLLEMVTIEHENTCANYNRGYMLGLYFGGNCRAPDRVTVCFQETSDL